MKVERSNLKLSNNKEDQIQIKCKSNKISITVKHHLLLKFKNLKFYSAAIVKRIKSALIMILIMRFDNAVKNKFIT